MLIGASSTGAIVSITGLPANVTIAGGDKFSFINIHGGDGDDKIDASKLPQALGAGLNGGVGNDVLVGGQKGDALSGGEGNDTVAGGGGSDLVLLDVGDDLFQWKPGDASDEVHGEGGTDTARVTGSKANEDFTIVPGGFGSHVLSNALGANLDLRMERLELLTLDGADTVVLNDLGVGGFEQIVIDLAATIGGKTADSKIDTVAVLGTDDVDDIVLSASGNKIAVAGLFTGITIDHAGKTDQLTIQAGIGADEIDASAVAAGKIALAIKGQDGDDTVVGSAGNDTVEGGDGNDLAFLGLGNDVFIWNAGDDDDTIEGEGGTDTVQVKGSIASEFFDISALAGRVQLTAFNLGLPTGTLDLDDVERLEIQTGGVGTDDVFINDLAGTDLKQVAIGLEPTSTFDHITVTGSGGNDKIALSLSGGTLSITGLPAQVTIANFGAADQLNLFARGQRHHQCVDVGGGQPAGRRCSATTAMTPSPAAPATTCLVGAGDNDVLLGGAGNDTLLGGGDNDKHHRRRRQRHAVRRQSGNDIHHRRRRR